MNDKELLELAAKAAGLEPEGYSKTQNSLSVYNPSSGTRNNRFAPLTDDGDALRLAVKLGILINPWPLAKKTYAGDEDGNGFTEGGECLFVATRRAIVRAAAEIGKNM